MVPSYCSVSLPASLVSSHIAADQDSLKTQRRSSTGTLNSLQLFLCQSSAPRIQGPLFCPVSISSIRGSFLPGAAARKLSPCSEPQQSAIIRLLLFICCLSGIMEITAFYCQMSGVLKALLHLFSLLFSHLGQKGKSRPYYSVLARSKDFPEKINLSSYIFGYSIRKVRFKKSHFGVCYQVNSLHILYHISFSALHSLRA